MEDTPPLLSSVTLSPAPVVRGSPTKPNLDPLNPAPAKPNLDPSNPAPSPAGSCLRTFRDIKTTLKLEVYPTCSEVNPTKPVRIVNPYLELEPCSQLITASTDLSTKQPTCPPRSRWPPSSNDPGTKLNQVTKYVESYSIVRNT